jgi:hypothetical protein
MEAGVQVSIGDSFHTAVIFQKDEIDRIGDPE